MNGYRTRNPDWAMAFIMAFFAAMFLWSGWVVGAFDSKPQPQACQCDDCCCETCRCGTIEDPDAPATTLKELEDRIEVVAVMSGQTYRDVEEMKKHLCRCGEGGDLRRTLEEQVVVGEVVQRQIVNHEERVQKLERASVADHTKRPEATGDKTETPGSTVK